MSEYVLEFGVAGIGMVVDKVLPIGTNEQHNMVPSFTSGCTSRMDLTMDPVVRLDSFGI